MFVLRVIVAGIVVMGLCAQTSAEQPFFQSVSGPQPISMDTSKVLVKFDPDVLPETEDDILNSIGRVVARLESDLTIDGFVVCSLSTGVGYSTFLDSLDSVDGLYLVEPFYLDWNDMPLLFGETFCLDFDDSMSAGAIDSIALSFNVSSVTQSDCMSNIYFLKNNDTTGYRVLELANMFYALGETQLSHPDCKVRLSLEAYQLYDEYESYQRYLKKVVGWFGDSTVWDFSGLARPVTVAILDDGVEEHEDLPADRILPGHDFAEGDDDPSPDMHAHGMAMTGVIGASHTTLGWWEGGPLDSTGIISLNPHVDILPVKIAYDDSATIRLTKLDSAINFAINSGADVMNCSWTVGGLYKWPLITAAFQRTQTEGRGGLGIAVICAAGNHGGAVKYPAKYDSCFAVGAIDYYSWRWDYSAYGTDLDIVAPTGDYCFFGDQWSFDIMGWRGYNPLYDISPCYPWPDVVWDCGVNWDQGYNCHSGGTSMATAMVSGVASLLIARDSMLTSHEVYEIMRHSADVNVGEQAPISPPDVEYGYGRVDAFRAVLSISRGNVDNDPDCAIDISDFVWLVDYMFTDGPPPFPSLLLADMDCSGHVDISDLVFLVDYMYTGGPHPINPCFEFE